MAESQTPTRRPTRWIKTAALWIGLVAGLGFLSVGIRDAEEDPFLVWLGLSLVALATVGYLEMLKGQFIRAIRSRRDVDRPIQTERIEECLAQLREEEDRQREKDR